MNRETRSPRRSFVVLATLLLTATAPSLSGCGHKEIWRARAVVAEGIRITPSDVSVAHGRLYVDTIVFNGTQSPLTIDRDAISVTLDSGAAVARSEGTFTTHKRYVVAPGTTQQVNVDFREDGFHWSDVSRARVEWNDAFVLDGASLRIVGMDVSPRVAR